MPSCAAIVFGRREKMTLAGVMALPNWRFMAQYMSFTTGFVGFSMGVSRMIMTSNRVDVDRGLGVGVLAVAPAVVDERKGGQERPERDAAGDPQGVAHATTRARDAAHVTPRSSSAGTYTPGASIDQCDGGSRPASVSVTCTSACRT